MRDRQALAVLAAILLVTAPALAGSAGLKVNVGQAQDLTKIEFRGAAMHAQRSGDQLVLSFSGAGKPDLTQLTVDPPKWLKSAKADEAGGFWNRLT